MSIKTDGGGGYRERNRKRLTGEKDGTQLSTDAAVISKQINQYSARYLGAVKARITLTQHVGIESETRCDCDEYRPCSRNISCVSFDY